MEISLDLHVFRSPESENHIFSIKSVSMYVCVIIYVCLCVCMYVCVYSYVCVYVCICVCICMSVCMCLWVCYHHNSKTNCRRSFKFCILHLCLRYILLETFFKFRTKSLCTRAHKIINTLRPMEGISW